MPSWTKRAGLAATAGATIAGLGAATFRRVLRAPLPDTSGILEVPGLHGVVTIDRDVWGVPHIIASHDHDLSFGNGFVHAQDRLWQMELNRRLGAGRLAELLGGQALGADKMMRRLGLRRAAEQEVALLTSAVRESYEAYCRGVNFYLTNFSGKRPVEFSLMRALPPPRPRWRPEPWSLIDSLTYGKVLALGLSTNWSTELVRASLVSRIGPIRAAALEPLTTGIAHTSLPGSGASGALTAALLDTYAELEPFLAAAGVGISGFSNNWVVDGTRTASGKPLLANDPHLSVQMPSVWYEIELTGPGIDVVGAGLPGAPGVLIGHNDRVAWGVTAALIDVQDLVIEQINPQDRSQYLFEGGWRSGTVHREEIFVHGQRSVIEHVLETHHGPVISGAADGEHHAMSLRWTALSPGRLAEAIYSMNRARGWAEFSDALRNWDAPPLNFVYADVDGNIGSYTTGAVPIRARGDGMLPVPGWNGDYEWTGMVPFEELPHALNPDSHQIVTANNCLVDQKYPHHLGHEWLPGYRAQRIADMLGAHTGLTVEDFRLIQLDLYSIPGKQAAELLLGMTPTTEQERAALAEVREWNGMLSADSVGGCVALVFQHHLLRAVFRPILGDLTEAYLGTGTSVFAARNGYFSRTIPFVYDLARKHDDHWFARLGVPSLSWDAVLRTALTETLVYLGERLGLDISGWRWGRLNRLGFNHILGTRSPLDRWLNRGPMEMGGDDNTIAAACLPLYSPHDRNGWAASFRQIVDLADRAASISMHTTGQSGHPASEHYDDMLGAWREGRYHPMSLAPGDVRRELGGHLVLEPAVRHAAGSRGGG